MKAKIFALLGWIVACGLVVFLISKNPQLLWESLKSLSPMHMMGVALFTVLANICQGIRYYFLWPDGKISLRKQAFLPFCMHSANAILPFRGGESVQPLFLRKWDPNQKFKSLLYWLLIDKFVEAACFLIFLAIAAWLFHSRLNYAVTLLILGWTGLLIWSKKAKSKARNLPMAILFAIFSWLFNWAVFISLVPSSIKSALALVIGTSVGSAIPGVPAGIGTYEYAFVWVLTQQHWTPQLATALAISAHTVSILITLAIGVPLGFVWGWPSEEEHVQVQPQITPFKQRVSNVCVYLLGTLVLVSSGVFWTSYERKNKKIGAKK